MSQGIPTLDLRRFKTDKDNFVQELGAGFKEFGFCGIQHHGIPDKIIENAYEVFKAFFALPEATKKAYFVENDGGQRGYTPFGVESAKDSQYCDLKEFWHVGREIDRQHPNAKIMRENLWVSEVPGFKDKAYAMFEALDGLGKTLLSAIALYLGQDEHFFDDKINSGNSILRAIHYPPIEDTSTPSVRAGQHEDINFITLLVGSNEPGLEILTREGVWIPVTSIEGTIVCNIADMLERLTNHVLPSTTHRVVNPAGALCKQSRYSIPFFVHPNPDFMIETLETCISDTLPNQYPEPILTNDFLQQRLREIGLIT